MRVSTVFTGELADSLEVHSVSWFGLIGPEGL